MTSSWARVHRLHHLESIRVHPPLHRPPSWIRMTTPAAILNSLNPHSQSERELGAELTDTTTDCHCKNFHMSQWQPHFTTKQSLLRFYSTCMTGASEQDAYTETKRADNSMDHSLRSKSARYYSSRVTVEN